jgi:hypothetical protein
VIFKEAEFFHSITTIFDSGHLIDPRNLCQPSELKVLEPLKIAGVVDSEMIPAVKKAFTDSVKDLT